MAHPVSHQIGEDLRKGRRNAMLALLALFALTALSWGLAHASLGSAESVVALGIAALKAFIVLDVFMDIRGAGPSPLLVVLVTLAFVALLCLGILADSAFR